MRSHRWLALAVLFVSADAQAQSGIFDNCRTIITDGLKEYSITTESSAYLNSVFDKYCESSGTAKSSGLSVGLDAVVKAIPIKFTGAYSSNEEAMRNFCRDYSSISAGRSDRTAYQERIVQRAYESFDQCIALAQTGVVVRHKVRSLTDLDFFVAPGFARPVTLRGIKTSMNIQCLGQDPSSSSSVAKKLDLSTRIQVKDNNVLNISCVRTGKAGADGETIYDEGTVTLFTDIGPNGNYGAFVPRDTRLAENQASIIAQQLLTLNQRATSIDQKIDTSDANRIKRCRICYLFRGSDGGDQFGQCQGGPRDVCSPWSDSPGWSPVMSLDLDGRAGWCDVFLRMECAK